MKFKVNTQLTINRRTIEETIYKAKTQLLHIASHLQNEAIKNAPSDSGELRRRIDLFPEKPSDKYIVSANSSYALYVEYGTSAHWAPIEPLKKWARRKLGDESLGYAIQQIIAKKGTKPHPFFRPAIMETKFKYIPMLRNKPNK